MGEYAFELVKALLKTDQANEYWLFYNSSHQINPPDMAGVKIIRRRLPNNFFINPAAMIFDQPKVSRLLGFKPDIFFAPHYNYIAWDRDVRNILTIHDLSLWQYPEFFSWKQRLWHYGFNIKKLLKRADNLVAVSEATGQELRSFGVPAEKISVIRSGLKSEFQPVVDQATLAHHRARLKLPERFLLYLGTIEPRKNIAGLIEAYDILRRDNPEINHKLVIAGGRGWKDKGVFERAAVSNFAADIIFYGYVEESDKLWLYNLTEAFVFPSFYEGFGFPPLEALACGAPTVAGFLGALPEVVGDAANLVNPDDANDIARGLAEILNDPEARSKARVAGEKLKSKFTWENTAHEYLNLFNKNS